MLSYFFIISIIIFILSHLVLFYYSRSAEKATRRGIFNVNTEMTAMISLFLWLGLFIVLILFNLTYKFGMIGIIIGILLIIIILYFALFSDITFFILNSYSKFIKKLF